MNENQHRRIKAGTVEEVRQKGCTVVTGNGHTIAVFALGDGFAALDNRCPHMGFPLDRGTVKDGILTCHWHHARFDLSSGGTFDPFADDARSFSVAVIGDSVWVDLTRPDQDSVKHWSNRLEDGLKDNIRLVISKSVLGLNSVAADLTIPLTIGARFGTSYSDQGWGPALTMLTCTANIFSRLHIEDRPRALYHGLRLVGSECSGRPPRFSVEPLPTGETRPEVFKSWFRSFVEVRDEDGAERSLRSAIELGHSRQDISDMVFAAVTDHLYLDSGHSLDFCNKAFELLDHIGWSHAGSVLTSLVHGIVTARRSEELNSWRHPIDLSSLVFEARRSLPDAYAEGKRRGRKTGKDDDALVDVILEDDPLATLNALVDSVRCGVDLEQVASAVAYAAFLRMARFHTSNEFGDWDTVHNTLTAANALHQALKRAPSIELARAIFDTAMSIYLDRFLNLPAQRIPEPRRVSDDDEIKMQILGAMDAHQKVEECARLVSDYACGATDSDALLPVLAHAMLREDSTFHHFQIVDAGFKQYESRKGTDAARQVLVGMSRFLSAHYPTPRAANQTYQTAVRLQRGEELFRET